jgi:hypothetical protein
METGGFQARRQTLLKMSFADCTNMANIRIEMNRNKNSTDIGWAKDQGKY